MGKYLVLWEIDSSKLPVNAKELATARLAMSEAVEKNMKKGVIKDYGRFLDGLRGYFIIEGTEVTVMTEALKYTPYLKSEVHPVASLEQAKQAMKAALK